MFCIGNMDIRSQIVGSRDKSKAETIPVIEQQHTPCTRNVTHKVISLKSQSFREISGCRVKETTDYVSGQ